MFTKNWYIGLAAAVSGKALGYYTSYSGGTTNQIRYPDCIKFAYNTSSHQYPSMHEVRTTVAGLGGVIFGTGTTPPSVTDYKLSGEVIATLAASDAVDYAVDENGAVFTGTYTLTNTGTEAFTVGEVGLICNPSSSGNSTTTACLIERTVLDEPVTIEPGGVGVITYKIRLNYPTA